MSKKTVGQVATELIIKPPETTSPIEQARESLTDYEKNVWECIDRGKKDFPDKDFYVVVITKREKLLENVLRHYFFPRLSCPTPDYDQAVYKYKHKHNDPKFVWVIPSQDATHHLVQHANEVVKDEQDLLRYVLAFKDGTLFQLAKDLNNEKQDSVELKDFTFKG